MDSICGVCGHAGNGVSVLLLCWQVLMPRTICEAADGAAGLAGILELRLVYLLLAVSA